MGEHSEQDYHTLRGKYNALVKAVTDLESDRDRLAARVQFLESVNKALDTGLEINKGIMRETLTTDNELKQQYIAEIQALQRQIREMKGTPA